MLSPQILMFKASINRAADWPAKFQVNLATGFSGLKVEVIYAQAVIRQHDQTTGFKCPRGQVRFILMSQ